MVEETCRQSNRLLVIGDRPRFCVVVTAAPGMKTEHRWRFGARRSFVFYRRRLRKIAWSRRTRRW